VVDRAQPDDLAAVTELLGRVPNTDFIVVARDHDGWPAVIRNRPLSRDDRPMPTRYWLVSRQISRQVDQLEAGGGVARANREIDPEEIAAVHRRYAAERDAELPANWGGPRPSGGVGGTRLGVKCLHAHLANLLAGGSDPVGRWVADQLAGAQLHQITAEARR
jgi:hypothetical protein